MAVMFNMSKCSSTRRESMSSKATHLAAWSTSWRPRNTCSCTLAARTAPIQPLTPMPRPSNLDSDESKRPLDGLMESGCLTPLVVFLTWALRFLGHRNLPRSVGLQSTSSHLVGMAMESIDAAVPGPASSGRSDTSVFPTSRSKTRRFSS